MFTPIDPPNRGYPQQTAYVDGLHGAYSFPTPGVGQIAAGHAFAPGFNPGGPMIPFHGYGAHGQGDVIHEGPPHAISEPRIRLQQLLMGIPDLPPGRLIADRLPYNPSAHPAVPHFNMVHAAQQLAQMLAAQTHAGLRRYGA